MTDAFNVEGRARSTTVVFDQGLDAREGGRNKQGRPQEAQVRSLERAPQEREVVLHPKVDSDLDRLPQKVQDSFHERVEMLRRGERHSSTHPLNGPLKGWHGTSVGGNQHRMIHRYSDGDLQVLSVGNHDEAYNQSIRRAVAMGQAGPDYDNLTFHHMTGYEYGAHPDIHHHELLFAKHPDHGYVGRLHYERTPDAVQIHNLEVYPQHQRRGVASQLMAELERRHSGETIDHGFRTMQGGEWARSYYGDPGEHQSHDRFPGYKAPKTRDGKPVTAMGQAGPDYDNLSFHHGEHPLYPADMGHETLFAHHPEHGDVGRLHYRVMHHPEWTGFESPTVHVTMMHVEPDHQRRGVASQLMDHLEKHLYPDTLIDHGSRRPDGHEWAKSKYNDTKGGQENSFSGEFSGGKSQYTKNGQPWNIDKKRPWRMPKKMAADWDEYRRVQDGQKRRYEQAGVGGGQSERDEYFGRGEYGGRGQEELMTPQKWMQHSRNETLEDQPIEFQHHWKGYELGYRHAQEGKINHAELTYEHRKTGGSEHFINGYHEGLTHGFGEDQVRSASKLGHFTPKLRVFTHTCGLDHRLWDGNEKLKPEVRSYILKSINKMWNNEYHDWSKWARVYFAGSEASEWTSENLEGNDDFDVLIGIDYDKFRKYNPAFANYSNAEITGKMNPQFRQYNGQVTLKIDGVEYGPFDRTTYVNPDSYDIRNIKPYAAYDVGKNEWVVKPPHLPHWGLDKLPEATRKVLRAADTLVRNTLKLPEPERTQQGAALFDAWHSDRSRAFGPNGEGWWDIANLREKWLDQAGLWGQLVDCKHKFDQGLGAAINWSNTPKIAMVKLSMPWENQDPDVARPRPKSVRRAGFAGFSADKHWVREFGDNGVEADQPDHVDEHMGHFIMNHSPNWSTWLHEDGRGARPENVDLTKPIYATQSHVSQFHIDRYKKKPTDTSWAQKGEEDHESDYPGHYFPMFVTHHGRTHVIEGHHRVAAAIQRGEPTIRGLHHNLDEKPVLKNWRGHDCPGCTALASQSHAEPRTGSVVGIDPPLRAEALSGPHRHFGAGLESLFPSDEDGPRPTAPTPWPQAGARKDRKTYDEQLVARSITHPHEFPVESVDPRELHATQPSVTRGGVKHYMEGGTDYGKQNGGDHRLGNDVPRIYHRLDDDKKILLSGHHRGAAALLKGEPLQAMVIRGGWGAPRQ